jgi:hypothetical protein
MAKGSGLISLSELGDSGVATVDDPELGSLAVGLGMDETDFSRRAADARPDAHGYIRDPRGRVRDTTCSARRRFHRPHPTGPARSGTRVTCAA